MKFTRSYLALIVALALAIVSPVSASVATDELFNLLNESRRLASESYPEAAKKGFSRADISEYYSSNLNPVPTGFVITFAVSGTQHESSLGITEDRIAVIYFKDASKEPKIKKYSDWLFLR